MQTEDSISPAQRHAAFAALCAKDVVSYRISPCYLRAARELPTEEDRTEFIAAVVSVIVYGEEPPKTEGAGYSMYKAMEKKVWISRKRSVAGAKGGRARVENAADRMLQPPQERHTEQAENQAATERKALTEERERAEKEIAEKMGDFPKELLDGESAYCLDAEQLKSLTRQHPNLQGEIKALFQAIYECRLRTETDPEIAERLRKYKDAVMLNAQLGFFNPKVKDLPIDGIAEFTAFVIVHAIEAVTSPNFYQLKNLRALTFYTIGKDYAGFAERWTTQGRQSFGELMQKAHAGEL